MSMHTDALHAENGIFSSHLTPILERILDRLSNKRANARNLYAETSHEWRLVSMMLLSDLAFFLAWSINLDIAATGSIASLALVGAGFWLLGALMIRTAITYVFYWWFLA